MIKYEIAISSLYLNIVHIIGPVPGSIHDIQIFKMYLQDQLEENERIWADKGYRGVERCITHFYN